MSIIWLSVTCGAVIFILLILGERPLPLFGGDRELAERVYKTLFMLLITGVVSGLFPTFFRIFANFARKRAEAIDKYQEILRFAIYFFENIGQWCSLIIAIAGVIFAVHIWLTH